MYIDIYLYMHIYPQANNVRIQANWRRIALVVSTIFEIMYVVRHIYIYI